MQSSVHGLRKKILLPIVVVQLVLMVAVIAVVNQIQTVQWEEGRLKLHSQLKRQLNDQIDTQVRMMSSVQEMIEHNPEVLTPFLAQDRDLLYQRTAPLYQELNRNHKVTHFYFTNTDRTNFLRVHQPDRFGDEIERNSQLRAEAHQSAQWGLSIGPLGTYTLRLVRPLFREGHAGELVGYIELGMEIEHVLTTIAENLSIDLILLLDKRGVKRSSWEQGMTRLARNEQWDRFKEYVVIFSTSTNVVEEVDEMGRKGDAQQHGLHALLQEAQHLHVHESEAALNIVRMILGENGERGYLLGIEDVTQSSELLQSELFNLSLIALLLALPLLALLYLFLGRLERWYGEQSRMMLQAKDDFLASMSHELRTPLTTIIGNCEFLSELESEPEKRRLIRTIEVSGRTQLALVNDILDMSKIESGKFSIDKSAFNLNHLLTDVEQMFDVKMRDKGLEFDIQQEHSFSHLVYGDGQRIGQVLINLLGNAVKFTERGKVVLRAWSAGEELIFLVQDSGIGMPAAVVERLFQRFEQADSSTSRRFGGTGLGLYISKSLVELMEGRIEVESEEGVGSTFRLVLPYQTGALVQHYSGNGGSDSGSLLNERFSGRILVAEDTPELQLLVRRILQNLGIEVTVVNNGKEAVEAALQQPPDLIVMDMQMPVMDGIEATRRLREAGLELPIIALTANVMQKHKDAFDAAGCNDFLEKPINKERLVAVLRGYLSKPAAEGNGAE